jgi:hypothetical protein
MDMFSEGVRLEKATKLSLLKHRGSKKIIKFHIFADNYDNWFNTLAAVKKEKEELVKQGYPNIRIYKEFYEDINDEPLGEECIFSIGNYPS